MRSSCGTTVTKDASRLAVRLVRREELFALDDDLREVRGDLMRPHSDVRLVRSPKRGSSERILGERVQTLIAGRTSLAQELQHPSHSADTRIAEHGFRRRKPIARQSVTWDREWLVVSSIRRVLDLRGIAQLDRDRVTQQIAKTPLPITSAVEKIVRAAREHTHELSVGLLREIEDPRHLGPT